jgi:glycosyltransferase XagB
MLAYGVMTEKTYEFRNYTERSLHTGAYRPHARLPLPIREQADLITRVLPPELAFLAAEGFSPEWLLNAVVAPSGSVLPVDQLLSEGKITEELYYRALANHLGCHYYSGYPPLADTFDAVKGLRCGVAPLQSNGAAPRMVIAPRAQSVSRLIEATQSGAIRSGSFAVASPKRFANLVRAYHGSELLDVALGRLPTNLTAREGMTGWQIAAVGVTAILALFLGVVDFNALHAVSSAILWLIFSASVMLRSMVAVASDPEIHCPNLSDEELPNYTVVVALYREARILDNLVKSIDAFDYPQGKLDVKLVIEQRDVETLARIAELRLPARYEVVVAPPGKPQTKPRALNIALSCARGELVVVYDAEDTPAPNQLRLAASRFAADKKLDCLQGRLAIRNHGESWLSRLFAIEYAILFDIINPGLCALNLPIPRGGTSNHFRVQSLVGVGAWVERHRGRRFRNSPGAFRLRGKGAGFGHLGGSSL